jgi:hypothetical protein
VELLNEEMRRVLHFFDWKIKWWEERIVNAVIDEGVGEGLAAYAAKQMQILQDMGMSFADQWHPELVRNGIQPEWPQRFTTEQTSQLIIQNSPRPHGEKDEDEDMNWEEDLD